MEIDFTDQIKKLKAQKGCGCKDDCDCEGNCEGDCGCQQSQANEKAGYPPDCNEGYEAKDGKCIEIKGYWGKKKNMAEKKYPGKNVPRRKDGVPKKNKKKRACKPGEHRDKSGKLVKNSKSAYYKELYKKVKGL